MRGEMNMNPSRTGLLLALTLLASPCAFAQTGIQDAIPQSMDDLSGGTWGGNTKYDGWYNLTVNPKTKIVHGTSHTFAANTGYPAVFTSGNPWHSPIYSQLQSDAGSRAGFNKTGNGASGMGPYPAGDSLYAIAFSNVFNTRGGTLTVTETNPVVDLSSVVFQIEIGSANGYDFYEPDVNAGETIWGTVADRQIGGLDPLLGREPGGPVIFPTLNLTFADSSTLAITANYAELITQGQNGTIPMPTGPGGSMVDEDILINLYGFQWDLTNLGTTEAITGFTVDFTVVEHSQIYAIQLDQSDSFNQLISSQVPEPTSFLLGSLGAVFLLRRRR